MGIFSEMMNKAVFLDRDGVINKAVVKQGKPYPPNGVAEIEVLPYVEEGIVRLKKAGYLIIVVTNQPDVARGTVLRSQVDEIHRYLAKILSIDDIFCCFHDDIDNCQCRKPKPGMILDASAKWNIDLSVCYLVGDRWRDIEAAKSAAVCSILIDCGYDEKKVNGDYTCANFEEVTDCILNKTY